MLPLPDRLLIVLQAGLATSHQTGGAFEMNIGDVVRACGFGPDPIDLRAIGTARARRRTPAIDALELDVVNRRARKSAPVVLDLSGIAKGYGVVCLAETAACLGLNSALCTIDGEVRAIGTRRNGRPWAVGSEAPDEASGGLNSVLALADMDVATSGDYRHFVTIGTTRLAHTIDLHRGAPLVAAPASVSVLSPSCMMADAMATALTVMGDKEGPEFAKRQGISALFQLRGGVEMSSVSTGAFVAGCSETPR